MLLFLTYLICVHFSLSFTSFLPSTSAEATLKGDLNQWMVCTDHTAALYCVHKCFSCALYFSQISGLVNAPAATLSPK